MEQDEVRTQASFGYLWERVADGDVQAARSSHVERVLSCLDLRPAEDARVLDAGCGDGLDARTLGALLPAGRVTAMDFSLGVVAARDAAAHLGNVSVVQGSVLAPPFAERSFDLVYSYGVLHHTADPSGGFAALARLVRPGGAVVIYVYTDLREEPLLRAALGAVTAVRRLTTRLSARQLFRLCRLASPFVYAAFGVPAAVIRRVRPGAAAADRIPFNFVTTPMGAVGDLYDRFSAPIEHRHSRAEVAGWYAGAGLVDVVVTAMPDARGWVGAGTRPA